MALLFIGLNGYAGAGKDTVAKMLNSILAHDWRTKEQAYLYYKENYVDKYKPYATFNADDATSKCMCIAFADQLKRICSVVFGIPVEYFYYNKSTSWVCINKNFEYTESKPTDEHIVTAEDYYIGKENYMHSADKYWMSLREILVYVGTYVCQYSINRSIFVNIVNSEINKLKYKSDTRSRNINTIICTDVRFIHEYDYIKKNNGIMINIVRDSVNQAQDIAEHELDMFDEDNFDYVITNDGTYEELFDKVWDLASDNIEFSNVTEPLQTRDFNTNNYLRIIYADNDCAKYKICTEHGISKVSHSNGQISFIDLAGGPSLCLGQIIEFTGENFMFGHIVIDKIEYDELKQCFIITLV